MRTIFTLCLLAFLGVTSLNAQAPTITSFTPLTAKPGDAVTLTGTNFNTTLANNIVFVGATKATVTAATTTSVTITVPTGAAYDYISLLSFTTKLSAKSLTKFTPIYSPAKTGIGFLDFPINQSLTPAAGTGTGPSSVAIGDLDGDGKPDMAVVNQTVGTLSIYRNIATGNILYGGSFATNVDFATASSPTSVAIGDIDGDGKPDVVVTNSGAASVYVFRNTSTSGSITTSSFAGALTFTTGTAPSGVAIGDLDGDGRPDLAVTNQSSNTISILRNTTTPGSTTIAFATKVDFTTGTNSQPRAVAIADLDGDGKPDVVAGGYISSSASIFRNTSTSGAITTASFAAKVDVSYSGGGINSVAIGDLDGDGKPDLALAFGAGTGTGVSQVYLNRNTSTSGTISFASGVGFATGTGVETKSIAIGDLDGDGKLDLFLANNNAASVSLFRNTATSGALNTSSFAAKLDFATGTQPISVAIGDLDGDGRPDLTAANFSANSVSLFRNADLPHTITSFTPRTADPGGSILIRGTNFNTSPGQNRVLFGGTRSATGAITGVSITDTTMSVTVPNGVTYGPISLLDTSTGLTAYSPYNYSPGFSGNKPDLTASDFLPTKVDVSLGTGNATTATAFADLDGDGKSDLVVSNGGSVSVFRNISTSGSITAGSFSAKVNFTALNGGFVTIADLDGDGKRDIIVATASGVSVYRNTATSGSITTSSFAAKVDLGNASACKVIVADMDGDGRPDLVYLNSTIMYVHLNKSVKGNIDASSFATRIDFSVTASTALDVADLDGDSKPDIALANSGFVSVYRNIATAGNFNANSLAAKVSFSATGISTIAIGDIDGDDKADLVAGNTSSSVSVLRNTATSGTITLGSFANKVDYAISYTASSTASSIGLADLDGDGDLDVAVTCSLGSTFSILRNTATSGTIDASSFAGFVAIPTTDASPKTIAIGDLDGDRKPDIVIANTVAASVSFSIFRNTSTSTTPPPTITSFSPLSANPGNVLTITGTGFNTTATNNVVFLGATSATVTAATATSISIVVPDGATYAPISLTNISTGLAAYSAARFRPIYTPAKSGIVASDFPAKQDFTTGSNPKSVAVGDLDGDGKADLAVVNYASNTVSIYRNISSSGSIGSGSFAAKVDFTTGTNPAAVAIGDIDGDGKPDLVVANATSNTISVYRNTASSGSISTSSFAANVDFAAGVAGCTPSSVAIGDLDGDGKADLAVVSNNYTAFSIFRNIATSGTITTSSFETRLDVSTGTALLSSIAIGDLDGDGKPDLAMNASTKVIVFRNISSKGFCSFGGSQSYATVAGTSNGISLGDLNGDGKLDIVAGYLTTAALPKVAVFYNQAVVGNFVGGITSPSFQTQVSYTVTDVNSVALADLDGDGKLDVVTSGVSVLRNTSTSTTISFATKLDFLVSGSTSVFAAVGDLDGDGRPDLVSGNFSTGSSLSVWRNSGTVINANLSNLELSGGALNSTFFSSTTSYSVTTTAPTTTITPTGKDANATIQVRLNGGAYSSITNGVASGSLNLIVGNNTIDVLVTAQDGTTTKTYTVTVVRSCLPATSTTDLSICPTALPYSWNGLTFFIAGSQTKVGLVSTIGCDSSATLNLSLKTITSSTQNLSVCPSALPYSWNGLTFNTAGSQTKTGLINSQGCDSSATLNLSLKTNTSSTQSLSICPTALPYSWNGLTFNAAGSQTKTGLVNSQGCDSSATLIITVKTSSTSTTNLSLCSTDFPYTWNGLLFNASGSQTYHTTNSVGCDSAATLNLTLKANYTITASAGSNGSISNSGISTICEGNSSVTYSITTNSGYFIEDVLIDGVSQGAISTYKFNNVTANHTISATFTISCVPSASSNTQTACISYTWNGVNYTTSGSYTTHFTNNCGLDSAATLVLTINQPSSSNNSASICSNQLPYNWNGLTFNAAGSQTKTGLVNSVGCDSSATLNLIVKTNTSSTTNLSICPSALPYSWNGLTFNTAGSQTKTGLTNSQGCDSSATLNLTLSANTSSTTNLSICPSSMPYSWNGLTFFTAGSQTKTGLVNGQGCDSSATLNLTLKTTSASTSNIHVCTNQLPYTWNGVSYNSAGTYTQTGFVNSQGCDSVATLVLTSGAPVTPTITISTASDSVCSGNNVAFNATSSNAGASPSLQWKRNGIDAGTGSSITFLGNSLNNNDVISCLLTSNNSCQTIASVTSNQIVMKVKQSPAVSQITTTANLAVTTASFCKTSSSKLYTPSISGGTWASNKPAIASVTVLGSTGKGIVAPNDTGTAIISYTINATNGCKSVATLVVDVSELSFTGNIVSRTDTLCLNDTVKLSLSMPLPIGTTARWASANGIGTLDTVSNIFTAKITGSVGGVGVLIRNTTTGCSVSLSKQIVVNVAPVMGILTGGSICGKNATLTVSNTSYASAKSVWTSSDSSIVKITTNNGPTAVVTALDTAGTVTITYTKIPTDPSNHCTSTSSATVTIVKVPFVANITTTAASNVICAVTTVIGSGGNSRLPLSTTSTGGTWVSSNNVIATVDTFGLVTGRFTGTATISYKLSKNGCTGSASYNVSVSGIPSTPTITYAPGLSFDPQAGAPTGSFCVGKTFGVVGTPNIPAGFWSAAGIVNITNGGVVTISAVGVGSITYTYVNSAGCVSSRTMKGNGYSCAARGTSVNGEELVVSNDFTMYPNPSKGFVNLNIETVVGAGSIVVTDLYGKLVKTQNLSMGTNTVNTSNLSKGFYLVSIITSEGKTTKKLIVE